MNSFINKELYNLSAALKRSSRVYDYFQYAKYTLPSSKNSINSTFARYSSWRTEPPTFLQIGACDGLWYDPLRYFIVWHGWRGILVEPIEENFIELRQNYRFVQQGQIEFSRAAVAPRGTSSLSLYTVDAAKLPAGVSRDRVKNLLRKTSFDPDHLRKYLRPGEDRAIVEQHVPAFSIDQIWSANGMGASSPDVLVMDVEGMDGDLLIDLDFSNWHPDLVLFEMASLSKKQLDDVEYHLLEAGYFFKYFSPDALAISKSVVEQLFD